MPQRETFFDAAAQSLLSQSATDTGKAQVPTRRRPDRRAIPGLDREMTMVESGLQNLFKELVRGIQRWPLYLYGGPGRGKTCAALALCDYCAESVYMTVQDLMKRELAPDKSLPWHNERRNYFVAYAELPGVAVLDELGEQPATGTHWTERLQSELVKAFADWRITTASSVAIYVSNLSPDDFREHYDGRIASRVLCGTWYELTGADRRLLAGEEESDAYAV